MKLRLVGTEKTAEDLLIRSLLPLTHRGFPQHDTASLQLGKIQKIMKSLQSSS